MDIIDIMLAKALTPQGQVETYAAKANKAAAKAEQAVQNAQTAISTVEAAADDISATQERVSALETTVQDKLSQVDTALENLEVDTVTEADVTDKIKALKIDSLDQSDAQAVATGLQVTYPDNSIKTINAISKMYHSAGDNEDGTMTQKAIKSYVNSAIATNPTSSSSGGISNLGPENSGKMVVVGDDGNIGTGIITEDDIIEALIKNGGYIAKDAVGLEIDYANKSYLRTQEATGKEMGADFDAYLMYGGRRRCNVADDGTINAFYGDPQYKEDGSNGQVMIYQPKFYYQRTPIEMSANKVGKIVEKDSIMISYTAQSGFKVHPLFENENKEEVDYVLFGAYEGGLQYASSGEYASTSPVNVTFGADKMSSVAGSKPITGTSNLTLQNAEQLAVNRGAGWHIFNMQAQSANQMLALVEFGTMNGQSSLGKGICNLSSSGTQNQSAITGSTADLGNASGAATSTLFKYDDGSNFTETDDGRVAISYRGLENPWGNIWKMLGGVVVYGASGSNGGVPYICNDFNYTNAIQVNYSDVGFSLPNQNNWISALGYGNKALDWVLMPARADNTANSALPIGDNGWFEENLSGLRLVVCGGSWSFGESNGLFYYGCDKAPTDSTYKSYGARLMFIPTKNAIYTANVNKWRQEVGE